MENKINSQKIADLFFFVQGSKVIFSMNAEAQRTFLKECRSAASLSSADDTSAAYILLASFCHFEQSEKSVNVSIKS